jgi:nicotinamide phosphoribosyltransferase
MYPKNQNKLVSYLVARKNMSPAFSKMVFEGLQPFIVDYLINGFDEQFFGQPLSYVEEEYKHYMDIQIGVENTEWDKVATLHKLGYLPLEIRALPEGSVVNMGIPVVEMTNTHPDFAWVVQWVECILQAEVWSASAYATVGYEYYKVAKYWYDKTVCGMRPEMAMADFGMRGMSCLEDSIKASAGWLMSFDKTSTIPALHYLDENYFADCSRNRIGIGAVSTEHSVMGANYAIDGDEITFVKRLLTDLYPNTSFSMVSDTYDYWNMVENILPACKDEIMNHNGKLLIRPDSGDMVEITIKTIESLWKNFGGTINEKGYKILDPHIGLIYGDGCTILRVKQIYKKLAEMGFAANNVVFGVGAFCFHGLFDDNGKFWALTRDMWGMAMKATYGVFGDTKLFIYKDPKTDSGLKKSHKGCCRVWHDETGYHCEDELMDYVPEENTDLKVVFAPGYVVTVDEINHIEEHKPTNLVKNDNFTAIRERMKENV